MEGPKPQLSKEKIDDLVKNADLEESRKNYSKEEKYLQEREELYNKSLLNDIKLRAELTKKIFNMVATYIFIALILVALSGLGLMHLSDTVLVTLISTTLASVIGLLTFIVKYFFKAN